MRNFKYVWLEFTDFFFTELPHVPATTDEIAAGSYENENHLAANTTFAHFIFLGHGLLLSVLLSPC
jgi:hypothetical protein